MVVSKCCRAVGHFGHGRATIEFQQRRSTESCNQSTSTDLFCDLYFGGSTIQHMVFCKQNKGHSGSRYIIDELQEANLNESCDEDLALL